MSGKNVYKKWVNGFYESEHEFCKSMLEKKYKDAYAMTFDMHRYLYSMRNYAKHFFLNLNSESFDRVYKETDSFTSCYIGCLELLLQKLLDQSDEDACQE